MKQKWVLLFICNVIFSSKIWAYCYYAPCLPFAESMKEVSKEVIGKAYDSLEEAIDNSEDAYEEYKNAIEEQNKLLSKIILARQANSVSMQKVTFLLEKITRIKDVNIDLQTQHALKSFYKNHVLKINQGKKQ